jgi:hypothetical protein
MMLEFCGRWFSIQTLLLRRKSCPSGLITLKMGLGGVYTIFLRMAMLRAVLSAPTRWSGGSLTQAKRQLD